MHQVAQDTASTEAMPQGIWRAPEPAGTLNLQLDPTTSTRNAREDRIGRYQVHDVIGRGSTGVVYKGYDPVDQRTVAIKVCDKRHREARNRFRREAVIGRMMAHRNLTEIYDFGADHSTLYLVQEYLSGSDLADMIRERQPPGLGQKLDLLLQVVSGLAHAHSKGVIHRDVKPSNIRVLDDGRVKIMDFGSAKRPVVDGELTEIGTIVGTVAYMSPERLVGQPLEASSDIYAFGVLAYELLSFRRPFNADRLYCLILQIQTSSPPSLTESLRECPSALAEIIQRCLSKAPEDRPRSFAELEIDLKRLHARHDSVV